MTPNPTEEQTSAERFEAALEAEVLQRIPHALHRLGRPGVERAKRLIRGDFQAGWDAASAAAEGRAKRELGERMDLASQHYGGAIHILEAERDRLRVQIATLEEDLRYYNRTLDERDRLAARVKELSDRE